MGEVRIPKKITVVSVLTGVFVLSLRFLSSGRIDFDQIVLLILLALLIVLILVILVLLVLFVIATLRRKDKGSGKGDRNNKRRGAGINRWRRLL